MQNEPKAIEGQIFKCEMDEMLYSMLGFVSMSYGYTMEEYVTEAVKDRLICDASDWGSELVLSEQSKEALKRERQRALELSERTSKKSKNN
jgi:hypothetical protein